MGDIYCWVFKVARETPISCLQKSVDKPAEGDTVSRPRFLLGAFFDLSSYRGRFIVFKSLNLRIVGFGAPFESTSEPDLGTDRCPVERAQKDVTCADSNGRFPAIVAQCPAPGWVVVSPVLSANDGSQRRGRP